MTIEPTELSEQPPLRLAMLRETYDLAISVTGDVWPTPTMALAALFERGAAPASPRPTGRLAEAWARATDAVATVLAGMIVALGYALPFIGLALATWALLALARRRHA